MNRLASLLVLIPSLAIFSCQQKPPAPNPPTPVNLATVKSQPVLYYDEFPATTQALSQVDLHAQVTGYVTAILFTEGTHVHKGQKLYEIDERLFKAAYDQAAANVKVAEGNQQQAQQDADRYQYLIQHNAVAKQTLDHAMIALQNAKNETAAAQQALTTAATNLTYSIITAPFDGTIGFSQVKLGNLVTASTTVLNTVSTDNPMAVDFLINESQLNHYEQLQRSKQHELDSLFTIVLPDHSIYPYTGKISVIDRAVDPQTGTIRVRLEFPNPKLDLRAGMSCVVRVHNLEQTPQIVIPARAVVEQMGEYFVYIAKDTVIQSNADSTAKGPRLRAVQVKVETGQTIGSNIVIRSGLHDSDRLVVDGVQALHDGSPITTANIVGPGAAGGRRR
ncbi:MAG TPA: efflux RND transporter periplasmic adaptor subunit [Puia sp.]|uniref:efflux RND transporter periplasmic adaptor subunit n=1 Tax=Puia sp. TaxID=2045100 RepID=UPI002BB55D38|nr:efflux RND transporter periplasmic adaptor subunit [Puia sp.]HVU96267.1 efflux RND transporter periplasmic adaptor subunit [Puia sp.]